MSEPAGITRRGLITGAVASGVVAGQAARAEAQPGTRTRTPTRTYDVVVVGAGLAGLSAADKLLAAGRSFVVLEARDRVGGRNLDIAIGHGKVVEMGGEWTGPGQDRVQALAKRFGIKTFETYATGKNLYYRDGTLTEYTGDIPPASPAALAEVEAVILELNNMAAKVSASHPWTAPQAAEYDVQTIEQWAHGRCQTAEARTLVDIAIRGVYGEDATQISLLDLLAGITGVGGDFNTLIGSAQSTRFAGGPQQLSKHLARHIGDRVELRHAVHHIATGDKFVTVSTDHGDVRGKAVIVTVPKPVVNSIRFTPALPPAYVQYFQRQPMGATIKVNAIYKTPFWRHAGLSGSVVSDTGPIEVVYDNSPPDGSPGVLVGFMEGSDGRSQFANSKAHRRRAALDCFVRYFGAKARTPTAFHDMVWARERYSLGAYGTFNPPGVLTGLGPLVGSHAGRIYFAGGDNSPTWPGYMDGAIGSGTAAAKEVLKSL